LLIIDLKRQNTNEQEIAGFKVIFQTMPKDIEALTKKEGLIKKEIKLEKPEKPLPVPPQIKLPTVEEEKIKEKLKAEEKAKREAEKKAEKEEKERLKIEKESLKIKIRTLYQEGKYLYKRKFYQEAIEKFEELLKLKPSWLANWYLNRARKKLIKEQKLYQKAQKEIEEKAKIEAEAKKRAEEKLKKEEEEKRLAEEKAKREAEERLKAEEELKLIIAQKIAAEEKAKREIEEKLKIEEKIKREKIKTELKPIFPFFRSLISKISSLKIAKIIGVILLILLIITGLIYWLGAKEIKKSQPKITSPPTEIVLPNSLFPVDETEIITLKTGQEKKLFQDLQDLSEKKQTVASFRRVLVKLTNQEQKYLGLEELLKALEISFPPEILNSLENNYTLFFYSQKDLPISPFLAGLGRNKLGLIIAISKKDEILQQVSLWEKTMEKDLEPLFLNKKMILGLSQNQFQERYYRGSLIRYLDLPDRFVSLNYTLLNNKFIITTSQESINSLIERIAQ